MPSLKTVAAPRLHGNGAGFPVLCMPLLCSVDAATMQTAEMSARFPRPNEVPSRK